VRKTLSYQPIWIAGWAAYFTWSSTAPSGTNIYVCDHFVFNRLPILSVFINSNGTLSLRIPTSPGGGANTIATTTGAVVKDRWYFYEVKTDLSGSGANLHVASEIRVYDDSSPPVLIASASGAAATTIAVSGFPGGTGRANHHDFFSFGGTGATRYTIIDDLRVMNGIASPDTLNPNNDWLGDREIYPVYPDGDSSLSWTPSGGGGNFNKVNEHPPSTAEYVESGAVSDTDLYNWEDIPGPGGRAIHALQFSVFAAKDDAGSKAFTHVTQPVSSIYESTPDRYVGNSPWFHRTVQDVNPNGNKAWTVAKYNASRFGVRVRV
jgi:hypothetical protein